MERIPNKAATTIVYFIINFNKDDFIIIIIFQKKILNELLIENQISKNYSTVAEITAELGDYETSMEALLKLEQIEPYAQIFSLAPRYHIFEALYENLEFIELMERFEMRQVEARIKINKIEDEGFPYLK